jgi:hypothetical protein
MSDRPSTATAAPAPAAPRAESVTPVRVWRDGNACEFLSVAQHAALTALTEGKTIRESAQAAGVLRNTVSEWLHRDPVFRAAYNGWRREVIDSARAKVLGLAEAAATAVANAVAKGDARIALSIRKDMGLTRPDAATGRPERQPAPPRRPTRCARIGGHHVDMDRWESPARRAATPTCSSRVASQPATGGRAFFFFKRMA